MGRFLWRLAFGLYGRIVPWQTIPSIAAVLTIILHPLRIRRRVAMTNLSAVSLGSRRNLSRLERQSFRNLLRVYLELPWLAHATPQQIGNVLHFSDAHLLASTRSEEGGRLLLSGHIGNWELLALAAGIASDRRITIPVRRQKDFGYLDRLRSRFGNRPIVVENSMKGRSLRDLADGGIVAMLADQSPSPEDPVIDFLGIPTRFHTGPARIALRFRPTVVVGFARRSVSRGYGVELVRLEYDDLEETSEGIVEFTRRYAKLLEREIRQDPSSWVWHHRRWKHSEGFRYE